MLERGRMSVSRPVSVISGARAEDAVAVVRALYWPQGGAPALIKGEGGAWEELLQAVCLALEEGGEALVQVKDEVRGGRLRLRHLDLILGVLRLAGRLPTDYAIYVPTQVLRVDPKWQAPRHLRRQESYILVYAAGRRISSAASPRPS